MKEVMLRTPAVKSKVGVDRENNAFLGFVVSELGEAKGHGADIDETFLSQIVEQGNGVDGGMKMRFTHPNLSNDGFGKYLGRARNFRLEGGQVRADGFLSRSSFKTPHGDLGSYVLDLAEEDPDAFGASIAFMGDTEERLDKDGTKKKGPDGKPLRPVFRLKKLRAVDVVDEPAATNSFFSTDDAPDAPARMATQFLDSLNETPDEVARRIDDFKRRYLESKGVAMSDEIKTPAPAAPTPEPAKTEPTDAEKALSSIEKETERLRCEAISMLCENQKCFELAAGMIGEGLSLPAARERVKVYLAAKNPPLESGKAPTDEPAKPADPGQKYREEFQQLSESLGIEGDEESYVKTCLAAEKNGGWVKVAPVARKAG
jgi:hypothetical protein